MTTLANEKQILMLSLFEEKEIKIIIQHWIRILHVKFGWLQDFDKIVVNYVTIIFMFDVFHLSSKLLKTFIGHTDDVCGIDYSAFDDNQMICSGSIDKTIRVWDVNKNKQIRLFNEHLYAVYCVKFSQYHQHKNSNNVICYSSLDTAIHFWDINDNKQLQILNGHTNWISCIEFSTFNSGRYLCSGSNDDSIRLWDIETFESLHVFNGHTNTVRCVDFSKLQNNNNNKSNDIGVIGGNGYTICSGSFDKTIRVWDIETAKQFIIFKGHEDSLYSVKYGSNKNTILSGSIDKSVRLWDIRFNQQIQIFHGHTRGITCVEYSPFVVNNIEIGDNSNVICSGSFDNTIRFWDIRSNKKELYIIKGNEKENCGILCIKFLQIKSSYSDFDINMCYGSSNGYICIWGN
ncbi:WD-40 repeat protein [Reticulomyxa filosa]|uniref:WD-40 repeat protein n=1 Tax=Reticulomyxa filosa TaxID=46433 RepID=X6NS67_RETFI|nr:WD-40 repeat protein [Reticulomyxa filosa]|eukprot:ETO28569.1 WD-40 repeat protein [Reticulomyxa filosa]